MTTGTDTQWALRSAEIDAIDLLERNCESLMIKDWRVVVPPRVIPLSSPGRLHLRGSYLVSVAGDDAEEMVGEMSLSIQTPYHPEEFEFLLRAVDGAFHVSADREKPMRVVVTVRFLLRPESFVDDLQTMIYDLRTAGRHDRNVTAPPCQHCGGTEGMRPHTGSGRRQQYCSDRCRQAAYRARR